MVTRTLFHNGRVHTVSGLMREGWLLVEGERIAALGHGVPPPELARNALLLDLGGAWLAPGLIDLHAHGAQGRDTMEADSEALRTMARLYARHGVTAFLATTMSAPAAEIQAALDTIGEVMRTGTPGATLLGAHVEGPYLEPARRGAQDARWVRVASAEEYRSLLASESVRLITLAPDAPENRALIPHARQRGIVVSLGHTRADFETVRQAVQLGATQITHLFNGMDPLHHREPGAVGAALLLEALTCELIADCVHVHPAVLDLAYRLKGAEGIALVTDAMAGTGMPDGEYELGGQAVTVRGGVARGADGALAGSTLTLERAVGNMAQATGEPLERVLPMASRTPARCLGLANKGDIAVGRDADLIVLRDGPSVCLTMVRGQVVWHDGTMGNWP